MAHKVPKTVPGGPPSAGLILRSVREFVAPGGILPWDLALLTEKPR